MLHPPPTDIGKGEVSLTKPDQNYRKQTKKQHPAMFPQFFKLSTVLIINDDRLRNLNQGLLNAAAHPLSGSRAYLLV